jgi:hypothetical protein
MPFFNPPRPTYVPRVLASMSKAEKRPMVYFAADIPVGQNIWWWTDGTISANQPPTAELTRKVWLGGRKHMISDSEAAILTAAGYGAYITYPAIFDSSVYDSTDEMG